MIKSDAYHVVLRPVLTEKSTWEQEQRDTYRFEVAGGANRIEIRRAVELLFEVGVDSVRTQVREGKVRRRGQEYYREPARKIAIVKLQEGDKIDLL